jgi:hypothetical protein
MNHEEMDEETTTLNTRIGAPPDTTLPRQEVSTGLRIAGIVLRSIFLCALLVLTVRVSLPQNESIWSVYETLGDLVRVALGFIVCVWILFHLFMLPKDAKGYRTWIYLGLVLVPLALACVIAIW